MVSVPLALLMLCNPRSLPGLRFRPRRRVTLTGPFRSDMVGLLSQVRGVQIFHLSGEAMVGILDCGEFAASNLVLWPCRAKEELRFLLLHRALRCYSPCHRSKCGSRFCKRR